jgi:hypothetical protein
MGQKFYGNEAGEDLGRKHGFSLSNDGKSLVLGYSDSNNGNGEVKVFKWDINSSNWVQKGNTLSGLHDSFGDGVNMSGNGNSISVTGDYGIQIFNYDFSTNSWILIGNKINEPYANVSNGFLNYNGTVLSAPGSLYIPEFTYLSTSLVRFYEFDENAVNINTSIEKDHNLIYPKPSNGEININFKEVGNYEISIIDLTGKTIYHKKTNLIFNKLDLSSYPKGIYIISDLNNSDILSQEKIILQ